MLAEGHVWHCHDGMAMDEMEFDRTRKSIRTNDLGNKDRKDMLDKFSSAGGKVLEERTKNKPPEEGGRHKGSGGADGGSLDNPRLPSQIARERNRQAAEKAAQSRKMVESQERDATSFVSRFFIKLNCAMKGITPYGQDLVKPGFLSLLNLDAKRALMECQILGNDLFMNNKKSARKIIAELDKKNPLMVELLERGTGLYNRTDLSELTGSYTPGSRNPVALDSIRAPIFQLIRKLYYFRPYQETYVIAADMAIDLQAEVENKHAGLYAAKKKKIRQEWRTLMNSIFPGLVLLVQRAEMKKAEPGSRLFEQMIGVQDAERIGNRQSGDTVGGIGEDEAGSATSKNEEENKVEETDEAVGEEQKPDISQSKELQYGNRIMRIYPVDALRKKLDPRGEYKAYNSRDKVLVSLLFFREFEEEYSFILTTPRINFNTTYTGGLKQDFHQKMTDIFEEARMVHDGFRKYQHAVDEIFKVEADSALAGSYVAHERKMEMLSGKRGATGREARIQLLDFADKIIEIFESLIADMRGESQIILNKDDPMHFDLDRDKRKRLNQKPIKDCIMQAYCYLLALSDRLRDGDLYGGIIEMSDTEFLHCFPQSRLPEAQAGLADEASARTKTKRAASTSPAADNDGNDFSDGLELDQES